MSGGASERARVVFVAWPDPPHRKSISWNATVNQTEVAFADNGQISSYLSCDSEWAVDGSA